MDIVTLFPEMRIEVAGVPLPQARMAALVDLVVRQKASAPSQCILSFLDADGSLGAQAAIRPGDSLDVFISDRLLFTGEATGIACIYSAAGEPKVEVRGYDRLHRLRKSQPVRAHVQVTTAELARELVSEAGFSLRASHDGPLLSTFQHRQSDFELLLDVARRAGLYFFARQDEVALFSGAGNGEAAVPLRLGNSLLEARVDLNGDPACSSVSVAGWSPLRAVVHSATVSGARVPHRGFGQLDVGAVGGEHEAHIADQVLDSDTAAEALAQSVMDRRGAAIATLWGVAEGRPELMPGALIEVQGLPPHLADRYVLTSAVHSVTRQSGYTVEVDTSPPLPQPQRHEATATLGHVSRVDDPDHFGRVRVTLPSLGDLETDWLQVVVPAAGPDKGLISLPDVEDKVLVLFLGGEPTQGLVLGGLYGQEKPYDAGVDSGRTSRFSFRTGKGQYIRLDQGEDAITVENAEGARLEMRKSEIQLRATEKMIIEAPNGSIVIKAQKIDFERG